MRYPISLAQQVHHLQDQALSDHDELVGKYKEFLCFLNRDFELMD